MRQSSLPYSSRAATAQFLASLSPRRRGYYRTRDWEVYTSDAKDQVGDRTYSHIVQSGLQGVCSSCSAFAVTSALETCVHRALRYTGH